MSGYRLAPLAPFYKAVAIVKSDTTVFPATRGIYVGVAGDLNIVMHEGGSPVVFKAVPVGVLNVCAIQVYSANTTATDMVALY